MINIYDMVYSGYVVENDYFIKYLNLIYNNESRPKEVGKTQRHHIIPRCYYKHNHIKIDNSENNIINLLYKDHLLAHYYLVLCSANSWFKIANFCSIQHLIGTKNQIPTEQYEFLNSLDKYQEIYEYYMENKNSYINFTPNNKGRFAITNGIENRKILEKDLDLYINAGWHLGWTIQKKETKKFIHNSDKELIIPLSEVEKYLNEGWTIGRCDKSIKKIKNNRINLSHKATTKGLTGINNGKLCKFINEYELNNYIVNGWKIGIIKTNYEYIPSEETKEKISIKLKNTIWVNKHNKNYRIPRDKLDVYLQDGYLLGRYIKDKQKFASKRGQAWINKNGINKHIFLDELDEYIKDGWQRGRDMSNRIGRSYNKNVK